MANVNMLEAKDQKLSIIIPIYNEHLTIEEIVKKVILAKIDGIEKEIIVIDDGSKEETIKILKEKIEPLVTKVIYKNKNEGKGAAIREGIQFVAGDFIIIQDADLEYDPEDYRILLGPIFKDKADVVYGSRFIGNEPRRVLYHRHSVGNKFLTFFSNSMTNLNLTDMETCYKVFRKDVLDSFSGKLKSKKFGIEPEMTARVARGNWRIYEVGISYDGRTYEEGKKINWKDGVAAIWHIIKYNLFRK